MAIKEEANKKAYEKVVQHNEKSEVSVKDKPTERYTSEYKAKSKFHPKCTVWSTVNNVDDFVKSLEYRSHLLAMRRRNLARPTAT